MSENDAWRHDQDVIHELRELRQRARVAKARRFENGDETDVRLIDVADDIIERCNREIEVLVAVWD